MEEENYADVREVYTALGRADRVHYVRYAGDHDYSPPIRQAAVAWLKRWLVASNESEMTGANP